MALKQEEKVKETNPIYEQFLREQSKKTLDEKRDELQIKLDSALERYLELKEKYGEDNLMTKFQVSMINLLVPINEFCAVVLTMEEAMIMLDETLGTIDDALDMINGCLTHNTKKYTVFEGMKLRRNMRRYRKTWKKRMARINYIYESMMGNSEILVKSISKMSAGMNNKMKNKKSANTNPSGFSSDAQVLLDKKLQSRGSEDGYTPSPAPSPKTSPSNGAPGVDDLV